MRFANSLRARPDGIVLSQSPDAWTIRVQAAEAWDAVRVTCTPETPIAEIKRVAMSALLPDVSAIEEYLVKLHGAEVEQESATLRAAGAKDASTLFLTSRRRRPIL